MTAAVPPVDAGDVLRLTGKAAADHCWLTDAGIGLVGLGIMTWLRDESSPAQTLLDIFDEPAQEILDTARTLVERGWVEVVPPAPSRCDPSSGTHSVPHRGCILR